MRAQTFVLALLAGTVISGQSAAIEASGTTVGVKPDAQAGGTTGVRVLKIEGPIYMGDVITTDVKGQVQINFVDDTKFVVGANSKVTIDAFVFDANKTAQDVTISAVKGAFRFITGKSPKQNYAIRTPTMTIGVRGTAFDLAVRAGNGESMVVVSEGAADVCDFIRRCMEANAGSMVIGSSAGVKSVSPGVDRNQRLDAYFPLLKSQDGLAPAFVVVVPASMGVSEPGNPPRHSNPTGQTITAPPEPPAPPPNGRPPP